jgi:hypothetical protein
VPQGIDLMTKAANGNYPEAQAQLGLMYAMGLGVQVDNAKAYDWLNKAVSALPEGTRRTVAEANRDAVLKRMGGQATNVAAAPAPAPSPAPAATSATTKTQATTADAAKAKPTTDAAKTQTAAKPAATDAPKTDTAKTDTMKTGTPAMPPAPAKVTETAKIETKPADTAAKPADSTKTVANTSASTPAKTPDTSTQVASAKAPETGDAAASTAGAASATATQPGVRIQLASLPSEELAWKAWKDLNGKYASQLTGLSAIVQSADLGAKGTFYRVQAGPFATLAKAQERCTAMKEAGLDCLVVGKP